MEKVQIKTPFFIFNPKSYLTGQEMMELALEADRLAAEYDFTVMVTAPFADLRAIREKTSHIVLCAQHMDGIEKGRGMGKVLPESLYEAGARATFLNHAENPLTLDQLVRAIRRAKELGILTIVCANSIEEAGAVALLDPDVVLCEPTELIGTGKTSDLSYMEMTNERVKSVNDKVLIMQAAGISNDADVYRVIDLGADGTGCTSGIVKADNPKEMLGKMLRAVDRARKGEAL